MKNLIFDIETGPMPQEWVSMLMPFDESKVSLGNAKRPEKIAEIIEEARVSHPSKIMEKAALSAETAHIMAIGMIEYPGTKTIYHCNQHQECAMLEAAWKEVNTADRVVGFNIKGFDLPLMVRRSWYLGVDVPDGLYDTWKGRVQWNDRIIDLMEMWQLGQFREYLTLDRLSKCLNSQYHKNGKGKNFAEIYKEDPEKALEYLANDLDVTFEAADRMGAIINN